MSPKKSRTAEPSRPRRPRTLSPEEAALWAAVAAGARPLSPDRQARVLQPPARPRPPSGGGPAAVQPPPSRPAAPRRPAPPELAPGATPGVDRRLAGRLRRGDLPVEATLDLHGMRQEAARAALADFVLSSRRFGRRCLLVITGKGGSRGGEGERGVLRAAVPHWLNATPLRPHVLAIAWARPKHGGEGALYVLLKRTRAKSGASGPDPGAD